MRLPSFNYSNSGQGYDRSGNLNLLNSKKVGIGKKWLVLVFLTKSYQFLCKKSISLKLDKNSWTYSMHIKLDAVKKLDKKRYVYTVVHLEGTEIKIH